MRVFDETVLFCAAMIGFLAVIEGAFRLGRRHGDRDDAAMGSHVGALQAALLGLLALLLGFNFAMAASRFDARRALIQEEVIAIETTSLRAQLLPAPGREQIARLLREYVAARIEFMQAAQAGGSGGKPGSAFGRSVAVPTLVATTGRCSRLRAQKWL